MKLKYRSVLPFAISLLSYIQNAIDHLEQKDLDKETLSIFVASQLENWNPQIKGISILDHETKQNAILFITGIALNIKRGIK